PALARLQRDHRQGGPARPAGPDAPGGGPRCRGRDGQRGLGAEPDLAARYADGARLRRRHAAGRAGLAARRVDARCAVNGDQLADLATDVLFDWQDTGESTTRATLRTILQTARVESLEQELRDIMEVNDE